MFDYSGKTIFVSGGTSGINLGIARAFGRANANVFTISRNPEKVAAAVDQLKGDGSGDAAGASADVRQLEAVEAAFAQCADQFGSIDVLVSGAAGNFPALASDISSNGFRSVLEIDVLGTHHVMIAGRPHLKSGGASVINISAPQAFVAMSMQAHVCAAKAGVDMITRTLALEWGADGHRVNSVVPGPIEGTEGMKRLAPGDAINDVARSVPLGRNGTPDDIASMCLFLGSDMASYVSGTVIPVDGGWQLNMSGQLISDMVAGART